MVELRELQVSYRQVALFNTRLLNPFNDWREEHVRQGFSWRPGSVSFQTLEDGPLLVEVGQGGAAPRDDATRVIRVPFTVDSSGEVEVASIADSQTLSLKPGQYSLVFEHGAVGGRMWCRFGLERVEVLVLPCILRADAEMSPPEPLVMNAEPATP